MYCPRCGSSQTEDLKFCKVCGTNLLAVRQTVEMRDAGDKSNKPWFAEMAISDAQSRRRQEELIHQRGLSEEVKRHNEIKAGVITASVGIGLMIFLFIFMQGIILGGNVSPAAAQILSRIWVAGFIPVMIGLALLINGLVVSKRLAEISRQAAEGTRPPEKETNPLALNSGETTEFVPSRFSVTEGTTKHLKSSDPSN